MDMDTTVILFIALDSDDVKLLEGVLDNALDSVPTTLLLAEGMDQARALIESRTVHIVVLDQRTNEQLAHSRLQQLMELNPQLEGFLLTVDCQYEPAGQVAADGLVHHYIQFPSDQQILGYRMRQALRVARLKQELQDLRRDLHRDFDTRRQQFVLRQKKLVERVQSGEEKINQSRKQLDEANQQLADGYRQIVRMFSNLTLRRMGQKVSGLNQRLNQMVSLLGEKCGLDEADRKHLTMAWMLRNVGKLSFSDHLLATPYLNLRPEEQREFQRHPDNAYTAMTIVRPLDRAATLVRQHKEYLDGSGYPLGLRRDQIEPAAQILTVLNDYTELTSGRYDHRQLSAAETLVFMRDRAPERYNQDVVNALEAVMNDLKPITDLYKDKRVSSMDLKPGMTLTRDLISHDGVLLLGHGEVLDQRTIDRIRDLEYNFSEYFHLFIE